MGLFKLAEKKISEPERFAEINSVFPYRTALALIIFSAFTVIIIVYVKSGVTILPWIMNPPFGDIISITWGIDCIRAGYDPYTFNAFDPWLRFFNYPKIWLTIFDFLNLNKEATNYIGIILAGLYGIATIFLFNLKKLVHFLFVMLIVLSPPVFLLLERGNSDIIIYLLVAGSIYYLRKSSSVNENIRLHLIYLVILFAAILKLYPVFLLPILLYEKASVRNQLVIGIYSSVILMIYFLINYNDFMMISKNTPRPEDALSFGKNVGLNHIFSSGSLALVSNSIVVLLLAAASYCCFRFKDQLNKIIPVSPNDKSKIYLFLAGAFLYAGTFFIGNNYDYRLVFVIFMIPFLIDIFNHSGKNVLTITMTSFFIFLLYGAFVHHFIKAFEIFKILASWGICFMVFLLTLHIFLNRNIYISRR
jgi:hypothetical protein